MNDEIHKQAERDTAFKLEAVTKRASDATLQLRVKARLDKHRGEAYLDHDDWRFVTYEDRTHSINPVDRYAVFYKGEYKKVSEYEFMRLLDLSCALREKDPHPLI